MSVMIGADSKGGNTSRTVIMYLVCLVNLVCLHYPFECCPDISFLIRFLKKLTSKHFVATANEDKQLLKFFNQRLKYSLCDIGHVRHRAM